MTVVITCYNYGRYLPQAVRSAADQDGVCVDIVIVDDASTDDSLSVAKRLAAEDSRVRVIAQTMNTGPVGAYNAGFAAATGEYIVRLDADDLLTPGSLLRATSVFERFPSVGMVYGRPRIFTGEVPTTSRDRVRGWTVWTGLDWLGLRCRLGVNCITSPEVVLRGSVARRLGGQRPELDRTHDFEMWLRVAAVADVAHVDGPDQAFHREHRESLSTKYDVMAELLARKAAFSALFDDGPPAIRDSDLRAEAMRSLAADALDRACRAYERGKARTEPITAYVKFARETWPQAAYLPEWRRLARRVRAGPRLAPWVPPFFARAVLRRLREELGWLWWERTGL